MPVQEFHQRVRYSVVLSKCAPNNRKQRRIACLLFASRSQGEREHVPSPARHVATALFTIGVKV
jgi:hypothetical protein